MDQSSGAKDDLYHKEKSEKEKGKKKRVA